MPSALDCNGVGAQLSGMGLLCKVMFRFIGTGLLRRWYRAGFAVSAAALISGFVGSAIAGVPGIGNVIDAISDEFEAPWSYDYAQNRSANGLWYVPFRGPPEVMELIPPPEGLVPGSTMSLRLRSIDNGDDPYPGAEDLVTVFYHTTAFGRLLARAENPSFTTWVHLPPISDWPPEQNSFGFRVAAWDSSLISMTNALGEYYPSIWTYRGSDGNGYLVARVGDGFTPDLIIAELPGPGWYTFGISWNAAGRIEYYATPGRGTFAAGDLIYTDTLSSRVIEFAVYHFFSLRFPPTGALSPDFVVDRCRVFTQAALSPPSLRVVSIVNHLVSLTAGAGTPGFAWRVERSPTLAPNSWQPIETFLNGAAAHSLSDPAPTPAMFYRLSR